MHLAPRRTSVGGWPPLSQECGRCVSKTVGATAKLSGFELKVIKKDSVAGEKYFLESDLWYYPGITIKNECNDMCLRTQTA